jgi:TolB protein
VPDLDERFRALARTRAPDLWPDIEHRLTETPVAPEPPAGRRLLAAAVALAVAAAGFTFVARALWTGPKQDRGATTPIGAKANGAIYFRVGGGDGPSWIEAIEPDGSGRRVVFDRGSPIAQIAWSPDGSRIAYQNRVVSERGIYVANADGSDPVRLTDGINDSWPSWSPDGSRIVFASTRYDPSIGLCEPAGADLLCPTDLYVMDAYGSGLERLTADPAPEYQPVWSPDGRSIAFVRAVQHGNATAIFAMDPSGGDVRQVSSGRGGSDFSPSWSPDGTRLVFAAIRNEDRGIWVVGADGSGERLLMPPDAYLSDPEWSPDGRLIAFVRDDAGSDLNALWVVNADGTDRRQLADAPGYGVAGDIAWRPVPIGSSPTPSPAEPAAVDVAVSTTRGVAEFPSAVAVGEGGVWVTAPDQGDSGGGEVIRLDPFTGEIVARIPVRAAPGWEFGGAGLTVGGGGVWTLGVVRAEDGGCCDGLVTRVDPATNAVADELRVPGITEGDLWVDGGTVFVLGFEAKGPGLELVRVDAATHETSWRVPVPGQWSQTVFVAGGSVWVLGTAPDSHGPIEPTTLYAFDPTTGDLRHRVELPGPGFTPAVAGDAVWLRTDEGVLRFDPVTATAGEPVDLGSGCCGGPVVPDGVGGVWVVSTPGGATERSIWHIEPTGEVVAMGTIQDRDTFEQMLGQSYAFDPQTQTIWVGHYQDSVAQVRLATTAP